MMTRKINTESLIKIGMVVLFLFYAWSAGAGVDASSRSVEGSYRLVQVAGGDTVWSIAASAAGEKDDIRNIVVAIKKANNLDNNVRIHPGQVLKVPVKN
ncbi:LysM peptidoglycan-binding domain-containing protein [Anaeroselena agilis]|uniref:LysM peptidoglycan-binding domain-containing protein n=1 Tax=Anaeroselena agilis TaxID=3063788 RepID=A0ABU3NX89_9FIRM|nr:LysM peptidoglycan-binding domain-containing protein [Selenomonadales bacterium 4137-cl]